jgi:4-amino-4-deoxy-L-arabinose transferase-like glycosyltransferase
VTNSLRRLSARLEPWLVAAPLLIHGALAYHSLLQHNPTVDEASHLLSGLFAWKHGDTTYYYVNPPLVKMLQTVPLLPVAWELPHQPRVALPTFEDWRSTRDAFLAANSDKFFPRVPSVRSANALLSLACGLLLYRWTRGQFGKAAGLIALSLWAFCPNTLAWSGVCTADLGATFFALAAMYALRGYVRLPVTGRAVWAGLLLGLAQLTKFSLLVLYPVTAVVWLAAWWSTLRRGAAGPRPRPYHLGVLWLVGLLVINLGYGFQGTGRPLGAFLFRCHALSGNRGGWGNRFYDTWLGGVPLPVPEAYVRGLDEQKSQADEEQPAYLRGQWERGGWWYYYLYALAVKLPLGTSLLGGLALALVCADPGYRTPAIEEGLLWLPGCAIAALLSWQMRDQFASIRYVLPALPFLFIGVGRVGLVVENGWKVSGRSPGILPPRLVRFGILLVFGAVAWNAIAVLRTHPHHLSYFNELVGGPDCGWEHLIESNIDWGQDLLLLKRWTEGHPEARPLSLAYYGGFDPRLVGLDLRLAPTSDSPGFAGPQPGWYAISVNLVCGAPFTCYGERGQRVSLRSGALSYFRQLTPMAKAGYSIFIYHITPEDAARVRARLRPSAHGKVD